MTIQRVFNDTGLRSLNEIARDNNSHIKHFDTYVGAKIFTTNYHKGKNSERIHFRLSTHIMKKCGWVCGDRVEVLYGGSHGNPDYVVIRSNLHGHMLVGGKQSQKGRSVSSAVGYTLYKGMFTVDKPVMIDEVLCEPNQCRFDLPFGSCRIVK